MKLALVKNKSSQIYIDALRAFNRIPGVETSMFKENKKVTEALEEADAYVVVGNYFSTDVIGRAGPVKKFVANSGKPFIVITGSLFNCKTNVRYVRLNVNGFANNFAAMPPSDPDRLAKLIKFYKIENPYQQKLGDKIVVAPNALTSPMMFGQDVDKWVYEVVQDLSSVTDRPIEVRYHRKRLQGHSKWHKMLKREYNKVVITHDTLKANGPRDKAHCAITYNSTFSVMSLLTGTSGIAYHPGNFVYELVPHLPQDGNLDYYPPQDQMIDHYGKLANMEWTVSEIENGTAWKVLEPMLQANVRKNRDWL